MLKEKARDPNRHGTTLLGLELDHLWTERQVGGTGGGFAIGPVWLCYLAHILLAGWLIGQKAPVCKWRAAARKSEGPAQLVRAQLEPPSSIRSHSLASDHHPQATVP